MGLISNGKKDSKVHQTLCYGTNVLTYDIYSGDEMNQMGAAELKRLLII